MRHDHLTRKSSKFGALHVIRIISLISGLLWLTFGCRTQTKTNESELDASPPSPASKCQVSEALSEGARKFLFEQKLANPDQEFSLPDLGITSRFKLVRVKRRQNDCLLVMNLVSFTKTPQSGPIGIESRKSPSSSSVANKWLARANVGNNLGSGQMSRTATIKPHAGQESETESLRYEVLVLRNGKILKFESAYKIPTAIKVGIGGIAGSQPGKFLPAENVLYYAEMTNNNAIGIMKTVYSGEHFCGFSAAADYSGNIRDVRSIKPTGRSAFDPTSGRIWKLKSADFSISRGNTTEICDVKAVHLDSDFGAYVSGSNNCIAPWGDCFLRRYHENGKWIDYVTKPVTVLPPADTNPPTDGGGGLDGDLRQ